MTSTLPQFALALSEERFDLLLDLSSWMKNLTDATLETHYCDESYLDLDEGHDELNAAILAAGFTYEQVETFAFDLAE